MSKCYTCDGNGYTECCDNQNVSPYIADGHICKNCGIEPPPCTYCDGNGETVYKNTTISD